MRRIELPYSAWEELDDRDEDRRISLIQRSSPFVLAWCGRAAAPELLGPGAAPAIVFFSVQPASYRVDDRSEVLLVAFSPDQVAPDQVAPDQVAPDQVAPDQVAPDQVAPDQVAPDHVPPDQVAPLQLPLLQLSIPSHEVIPRARWWVCSGALTALAAFSAAVSGRTLPAPSSRALLRSTSLAFWIRRYLT